MDALHMMADQKGAEGNWQVSIEDHAHDRRVTYAAVA